MQNKDTRVLKAGDYVKFAPNTRTACVFALIGESGIIGTCAEQVYPGKWGLVDLLNTVSAANITQDSDNRFVTDAEKVSWNNKPDDGFVIAMAIAL